jgi:hypothetical protein
LTPKEGVLSVMAFHENAGPRQVDFDLPFLKSPFPSWREGVQSGPERSRARSLRRSEPLTARTDLSPFRQEGKGAVARYFYSLLCSCSAPSQPCRHPSIRTLSERFAALGASWVFSFQSVLPPDFRPLLPPSAWKVGQAIDAVPGTRRWGAVLPIQTNLNYAAAGSRTCVLLRSGS